MDNLFDLLILLVLGAIVGVWLKLSVARERAVQVARQQCLKHGLQLLDETVGMRGMRLRRVNGLRRMERCYTFEVSINGNDREPGKLWMIGTALSGLSLPTIEQAMPEPPPVPSSPGLPGAGSNVVSLSSRRPPDDRLH